MVLPIERSGVRSGFADSRCICGHVSLSYRDQRKAEFMRIGETKPPIIGYIH